MYRLAARMRSTPRTRKFAMVARRQWNNSGGTVFRVIPALRSARNDRDASGAHRCKAHRIRKIQKPV
jgi:hypothetical protein